jgi:hypothetical protein
MLSPTPSRQDRHAVAYRAPAPAEFSPATTPALRIWIARAGMGGMRMQPPLGLDFGKVRLD